MKLSAKSSTLRREFDKLTRLVYDSQAAFSFGFYALHSKILTDAVARGWKGKKKTNLAYDDIGDIGISYGIEDSRLLQEFKRNVYYFSAAKTYTMAKELNELLPGNKTYADFKAAVEQLYPKYCERYLQSEYNLAYNTAQQSVIYRELVEAAEDFPTWIYRTVGDDRVREAHKALDGKMFPADDPVWDTIYPPNGYGCRCYVEPSAIVPKKYMSSQEAFSALEQSGELKKMKSAGFAVNRAKEKYIFSNGSEYFKNANPSQLRRLYAELMEKGDEYILAYKNPEGNTLKIHYTNLQQKEVIKNFNAAKEIIDFEKVDIEFKPHTDGGPDIWVIKKGKNIDAGEHEVKTPDSKGKRAITRAFESAKVQGNSSLILHDVWQLKASEVMRQVKGFMALNEDFEEFYLLNEKGLRRFKRADVISFDFNAKEQP